MKIFNKKFRTKVSHFSRDHYTVSYAYYRLIPIWYTIRYWFEQDLVGNTESWSPLLMKVKDAEKLARQLKSIECIKRRYKNDEKSESEFLKRKKEYRKKSVPYMTKIFKFNIN